MSRRTVIVAALGALLATAVGLVIVLARESSAPADRYERLRRLATRAHAGMYVPAHETATITGAPITLAEVSPGRRQLLFFLTTSCPYCRASLPAWRELAAQAEAGECALRASASLRILPRSTPCERPHLPSPAELQDAAPPRPVSGAETGP